MSENGSNKDIARQYHELLAIADALPVLIAELDSDCRYTYVNNAYEDWLGLPREQILGRNNMEVVGDSAYKVILPYIEQVLAGEATSFDTEIRFKHGKPRYVHAEYMPKTDVRGEVTGFFSVVTDLGETRELQQQHASELQSILDAQVNAVISIDKRGHILHFSCSAEEMFGYSAKEVLGENVKMLMPDDVAKQHDEYVQRYLDTGEAHIIGLGRAVTARRKSGEYFPMRLFVGEAEDENGSLYFIGSCLDMTLENQRDEQLRRTQKMDALGKLTGGIAHDYNNVLNVIMGYAELLQRIADADKIQAYLKEILHAVDRGTGLTRKLLAFSRKKTDEKSVSADINQILENERMMLQTTLTAHNELIMDLQEDLWPVFIDPGLFEDAVLNMTINAGHAMPEGGRFEIRAANKTLGQIEAQVLNTAPGDYVQLSVSDTGVGMDEEVRSHIFDPFFSTKGEKGSGLGMSQVYGFVTGSGGVVNVYSEPGLGTRFSFYFPRYRGETDEKEAADNDSKPDYSGHGETVLVVDDDDAVCRLTTAILMSSGYRVVYAASGQEALEVLEQTPVDLVVTDVIMPAVDGYELAHLIWQKYPDMPIQLMSGFSDDRGKTVTSDSLFKNLIPKPFTSAELLARVQEILSTGPDRLH